MQHRFDIVKIQPVTLAAVETHVTQAQIPAQIPGMLDTLHAWLRRRKIGRAGLDHVVYDRFSSSGMRMRVGIPVARPFSADGAVIYTELDAGMAAHTRHVGAYSGLIQATRNLDAWCASQAHRLAGMSWEVYGEWQDDPARLVTDIFFRLAS